MSAVPSPPSAFPINPTATAHSSLSVLYPQPPLDGKFSAFGRVTEGIDVVEKISHAPAGANGFTDTPVRIQSVTIEKKKTEPFVNATLDELRRTITLKTTVGTLKIKMEPDWAPTTFATS